MTDYRDAVLSNTAQLERDFDQAIAVVMNSAATAARKPQEPDYVAKLVLDGVPILATALQRVMMPAGIQVSVSSVFCHQRPMVKFNRGRNCCELGDVLFVHRHRNAFGWYESNALLCQAKMSSGAKLIIPMAERHQLELYEHWPRFRYVRSGYQLNEQHRDVKPKTRHLGAQYLLIADRSGGNYPATHSMSIWPAHANLHTNYSLSAELIRFLAGVSGRPFAECSADDPTGWTEVIWDLLNYSATSVFNRRNSGVVSASRLGGEPLLTLISQNRNSNGIDVGAEELAEKISWWIGGSRVPPDSIEEKDPPSPEGVPLILIETNDSDGWISPSRGR